MRVGGGRQWLRRALRRRRRVMAAGLAMSAATLAATGSWKAGATAPPGYGGTEKPPAAARPPTERRTVSALVRIADAEAVRLLRAGDRVDVVAAAEDSEARVIASGARVARVPGPTGANEDGGAARTGAVGVGGGALVVLSVPRDTATALAGAGAAGPLAVTVWSPPSPP
ncbi:hypothetical protein [Streptomyces sp. GC420]|uniref:hypothetical protein n=1 Tax=Streptomyces sp. GC420 TaxID=2697568 RepID=UPI0028BDF02C|nr:hypothetical protein [Streptomyces sp. GC420]